MARRNEKLTAVTEAATGLAEMVLTTAAALKMPASTPLSRELQCSILDTLGQTAGKVLAVVRPGGQPAAEGRPSRERRKRGKGPTTLTAVPLAAGNGNSESTEKD